MPDNRRQVDTDKVDRPDGLREGVMNDSTGVQIGIITDMKAQTFERPKMSSVIRTNDFMEDEEEKNKNLK